MEPFTSFGAVVYREGCQRVAYTGQLQQRADGLRTTVDVSGSLGRSVCVDGAPAPADSPEKLKAIQTNKESLVATVDAILPKPFLTTLETFLEQILPLSDDGTMETAINSLAMLLGTMHDDPDFAPALARLASRNGYRPTKTAAGLVHTIVEYPEIDEFLGKLLALIAPGGTAETEWKQVLTALSKELKTAEAVAQPNDPERTLKLALGLIFSTHTDLASGVARPLVKRDYRGLAMAATDSSGKVMAPFVDQDGDGLADVDASGRFVDAAGAPIAAPDPFPAAGAPDQAPRDLFGRALTAPNATSTLYQYLDLDGTVVGGLTREALTLMDPQKDTTLGLVWGAAALLGPRVTQTKMYMDPAGGMIDALTYQGFDTNQSAVLDLAHAFFQLLGDPNIDLTLQSANTLLTKYESPTARAIGAMLDTSDLGKLHPEAQIAARSTLYDDLMPLFVRVLKVDNGKLAEDLLTALQDPRLKAFGPMTARLMQATNQLDFDHNNGPDYPLLGNLNNALPPDRTKPDVDYNRSLLQRIAHTIHDSNGVQFCNKQGASFKDPLIGVIPFGPYDKCKLFQIDDLALFYILNMSSVRTSSSGFPASAVDGADFSKHIQDSTVKSAVDLGIANLETQTGITGFGKYPTPAALNRSLFLRQNEKSEFLAGTTEDITCKDGDKFIDVHDHTLVAWETTLPNNPAGAGHENDTFFDAVQPLIDAFAKHDECLDAACTQKQNAAKLFIEIFSKLHEHYASPNGSFFGHQYQSTAPTQPRFAHTDNVVSYEPLLAEVLGKGDIMPAILDLAPTLNTMTIDGTTSGLLAKPLLIKTARYLLDPDMAAAAGVKYRNGSKSTVQSDGATAVPQASVYYLLADAFAHKRSVLAQAGPQADAWKAATSALIDQMLTVEKMTGGGAVYRLKNRRMHAITSILVDFLRGRIKSHAQAGDLDTWVHGKLTQDVTDLLGGPVFAALGDFVTKVEADEEARTNLYKLVQYLVNETDNDLAFATALTTLADQAQTFLDDPDLVPVARVLGAAMDPQLNTVDAQLTLIKKARDLDTNKALLTVLRNLYQPNLDGGYPASDLADLLSELNRTRPGQGGSLDAGDYRTVLSEVQSFLTDNERGFTRFLNIVKNRGPH